MPWESLFLIELKGGTVRFWMGPTGGSIGMVALLLLILIKIWNRNFKMKFFVLVPCSLLLIGACCFLFLSLVLPDFKWEDELVYKNGSDYLVQEQFNGFVTSNLTGPRLLMTKSPYSCIRKIEVKEKEFDGFARDTVSYAGKVWVKELSDSKD